MKRIARDWSPMTQGAEEKQPPQPSKPLFTGSDTGPMDQDGPALSAYPPPRIEGRKLWPLCQVFAIHPCQVTSTDPTQGGVVPQRRRQFCSVNAASSTMIFRASRTPSRGASHTRWPWPPRTHTTACWPALAALPLGRLELTSPSTLPSRPASVSALSTKPSMHHTPFRQERMLLCVCMREPQTP